MLVLGYLARHPERISHAVVVEPGILNPISAREFVRRFKASQSLWDALPLVKYILLTPFVSSKDGHERFDYVMTRLMNRAKPGGPYQREGEAMPADAFERAGYAAFDGMLKPVLDHPESFTQNIAHNAAAYKGKLLMLSSECSFIGYRFQQEFHIPSLPAQTVHLEAKAMGHNMLTLNPACPSFRSYFRFSWLNFCGWHSTCWAKRPIPPKISGIRTHMTLHRLHSLSAVLIAAFACLHIANHLAGLAGTAAHIAFMEAARPVYRFLLVELALLSCIAFQVVSGLVMVVRGWKQRHGFIPWLQAISGAYLSFFLVVHVGAVLFGRAALDLDTNFYFAAAGFHVAPFQFFFAPYYFFAVVALFTHLGCAAYWHAQSRPRVTRVLVVALPAAVGAVVSLLIVLSLAGAFFPVDVPAKYKATYGQSTR